MTFATAIGFRSKVNTNRSIVLGYRSSTFGASDKVGIGTPSPARELDIFDVDNNGDAGIDIAANNSEARHMTIAVNQSSGGIISMVTANDLFLRTDGTNRVTIKSNGLVGIGTTSPPELLTVRTGSIYAEALGGFDSNRGFLLGESPGAPAFGLVYDGTGGGGDNKTHLKEFIGGDTTAVMTFKGSGDVGVGTTTPDVDFEIERSGVVASRITSSGNSDVRLEFKRSGSDWRINNNLGILLFGQSNDDLATVDDVLRLGGGSVTPATDNAIVCGQSSRRWTAVYAVNGTIQTSDERLKSNINPVVNGMEVITKLKPVSYRWNSDLTDNGKEHLGFLAQDLQEVLPQVVYDHEWTVDEETGIRDWVKSENMGVNYSEIIPVLVKGLQEQQAVIDQLSDTRNHFKKQQLNLENQIKEIEKENEKLRSDMRQIYQILYFLQKEVDSKEQH